MEDPALWGIIGLVVFLFLHGFFSAALQASSSVRRQELRDFAEEGNTRASLAYNIAQDSIRFMSTFQLAKLITSFLIASLITILLIPSLAQSLADRMLADVLIGYLVGFFVIMPLAGLLVYALTEMLPEVLVHRNPTDWAIAMAGPSRVTIILFSPLVAALVAFRRGIARPLGGRIESSALVTEEEIMTLVDAGEEEGSIEQDEKEMIYSIFQLDETLAREIMVPRIDIVGLEIHTPLEEALQVIITAGHSRIPVFEETLDKIKGLLYAKDLLEVWQQGKQSVNLESLLRPAMFVPESKRVSDLLHEMQNEKLHLAVIIDEYGGTAGLVTIEDIVEEIVGEIFDEYDEATEATYEAVGQDEYIVDARIDLDDLNRLLDTELSDEMGDTLGGFIYARLGKVPEPGEVIVTKRLNIEVLEVIDRRIRKVRVVRRALQFPTSSKLHESTEESPQDRKNGR
nr:HlyC/CorC family transporter [Anaerolineae bacterium]